MGKWGQALFSHKVPTRKRPLEGPAKFLVARTRFELVISALRGRRPEPLDERAICNGRMAGMEGVEPPLTEPESAVLPLDDIPMMHPLRGRCRFAQESILRDLPPKRKPQFEKISSASKTAISRTYPALSGTRKTMYTSWARFSPCIRVGHDFRVPDAHRRHGPERFPCSFLRRYRRLSPLWRNLTRKSYPTRPACRSRRASDPI